MSERPRSNDPAYYDSPSSESPIMTIISALLFLYVGFGMGLTGISGKPLYDGSVAALTWSAKIVGVGLLLVALLVFGGIRAASWLDLVLSAIATLACAIIGVIWMMFGDMQGILLLAFGLLNGSATRAAWARLAAQRIAGAQRRNETEHAGTPDGRH